MANHLALHLLSQALCDFLARRHATFVPAGGVPALPAARFDVLSSSFVSSATAIPERTVSLLLHRVSVDRQLRNARQHAAVGTLGLGLHFFLNVWASVASDEQTLWAWAVRELHQHAVLDRGALDPAGNWAADDCISLAAEDVPLEDLTRFWTGTGRGPRLTFPFLARVVRLDPDPTADGAPVVATRFTFTDDARARSSP